MRVRVICVLIIRLLALTCIFVFNHHPRLYILCPTAGHRTLGIGPPMGRSFHSVYSQCLTVHNPLQFCALQVCEGMDCGSQCVLVILHNPLNYFLVCVSFLAIFSMTVNFVANLKCNFTHAFRKT